MLTTHMLMEDVQGSGLPTLWPLENAILITFLRAHPEEILRALILRTSTVLWRGPLLAVSSPQASSLSESSKANRWISADSVSAPTLLPLGPASPPPQGWLVAGCMAEAAGS